MAKYYEWEDYYIPGTEVLQNRFNETDPAVLRRLEEAKVRGRMILLQHNPVKGHFDFAHMKAIHKFLFQDVYEWAGEERTAPSFGEPHMNKEGHRYFPAGEPMKVQLDKLYRNLRERDKYLVGLPQDEFVEKYAELWNEINIVHAFREGNTRSQFIFFGQLAEHAGYQLDADAFAEGKPLRDEFVKARFEGQKTDHSDDLAAVLYMAIKPLPSAVQDDPKGSGIILDKDPATSLGVDVMSIVPTVDGDAG